jgi:tetratricopeptide (TPR) repeat protein/transcriptional regulator with XRE-family HTH domain
LSTGWGARRYTLSVRIGTIQAINRQSTGSLRGRIVMATSHRPHSGRVAAVGARLGAWRQRALLTQEQLADRAGVSVRTIRQLEAGQVRHPRSDTLRRLADALGLTEQERAALTTSIGGTGALAPMPSVGGAGCQLPMDVAGFTGRADSLTWLDRLLTADGGTAATVVISAIGGTAGVGKTALAIHWAHQVRAHFPDGQLYVNLRGYATTAPMRPIEALAHFLQSLGVAAEQVPVEIEEAAALYRTLLADKRVLVVLDNARHAEQIRPLVPGSKGCLVVVTSRDRLAGLVATHGAHRLGLDVLAPDEAVMLLARIVGEERVATEPEATAAVAEACGFLPLALRIAAANLLDQPQHGIAGYVSRLRAGDRLAELAVAGDPQAAVGVAFDASYATLDPQARRLFRLLGLVPGTTVTAPAVATLTTMQLAQVDQVLERLAGGHLLGQHAPGRFGFHDLLRLYARGRTEAEDSEPERQAALGRLLAWYLHTAAAATRLLYPTMVRLPLPPASSQLPVPAFTDRAQALAWLDAERSNLVAAVQHAAEHGPRPSAWLLADALHGYLWQGMYVADWSAVAEAALAAAQAEGGPPAQSTAQLSLADLNLCLGRYRQAIEHYSRALALNQQIGWLEGQAATLSKLGVAYTRSGRLAEAADHHHQALTLNQRIGRLGGQANNLGNLGVVYLEQGRLQAALDHHTQALALFGKLGYRGSQGTALGWLGEIDHARGQLDRAVDHANAALAIQREVGDRGGEADTLRTLAGIARDTGRLDQALELATTAAALAGDTGERRLQADALNTLASVHLHRGSLPQARDIYGQALELARATQSRYPEVVTLVGLATTDQRAGRHDQALVVADQALTLARQAGFRLLEGQALTTLASIHLAQDQPHRAIQLASQALAIQRDTGHRLGQAHTLLVLGRALHPEGADAALPHRQQALALFTEIGTPEAEHAHALFAPAQPTSGGDIGDAP